MRARLWILAAVVTFGTLVAMSTTSWTATSTLLLVDERGTPAADAYVRYYYAGHLINLVHPVSYVARGSVITRADDGGRVTIPFRLQFRSPLPLSAPPSVFIADVFVPRLHNAFGPIAPQTMSRPGVFMVDERREHVTIFDVSQDPERWERSLWSLFDCIRSTVSGTGSRAPAAPDDARTAAYARELIGHLRRDYASFVDTYGRSVRARPLAPEWQSERERQLWRERIDVQLAREPLWGPYVERMWRQNLKELDRLERSLK
jgi:hypothetical protein